MFDKELAFLMEACKMARGDIAKAIKISETHKKIDGLNEDSTPKIVESLKQKCYLKKGNDREEFMITRKGFYYAIEASTEPPTQYGMISYQEVNRLYPDILHHIHKETKNSTKKHITLSEINTTKWGGYGKLPICQIMEMLEDMGFITYRQDKEEIEITPKGQYEVLRRQLS